MRYIIILFVVSLASCATNNVASYEKLAFEINAVVKNAMPATQVESELTKLGFNCHEGTSIAPNEQGIFECSRNRSGFLYGCVHRIWYETSSKEDLISGLKIHEPACASF